MKEYIDGTDFKKMIASAAACIENQKQEVNELNVFPVPDGDTGTNMSMTIGAAVSEMAKREFADIEEASAVAAAALLRGARGNSGVILSLLFRGVGKSLKGKERAGGMDFAQALEEGVSAAYKAVMKPAEGTILTVSRVSAAQAIKKAGQTSDVEAVLETALDSAKAALKETVHQNPVLEKAGVIDAGGMGYVIILEGMLGVLKGIEITPANAPEPGGTKEKADFGQFSSEDITFTYCTEFIVTRENKKDPLLLRAFLDSMGDSLVLVDDEEIIKVHVHTDNPGKALEEALGYGSLLTVKIENMRNQHTEQVVTAEMAGHAEKPAVAEPEKKYGFVAVCAGEGVGTVFRDLGADRLIRGGQTMNPSTQDILSEIDRTPSEVVFVFPNNKNIIMAAEQCVPLSDKQVIVVPSRTIPQGIAALLSFDPDMEISDNMEAMNEALEHVKTGQITYAARDSEFDGRHIAAGDYMALQDSRLLRTGPDIDAVIRDLAGNMLNGDSSFVTIFYGENVTEEEAAGVERIFAETCPDAEINLLFGGQPVYYYLISVE